MFRTLELANKIMAFVIILLYTLLLLPDKNLSVKQVWSAGLLIVPNGATRTAQATCEPGELVKGGVYYNKGLVAVNQNNYDIISRAASSTTWEIEVHNYGPFQLEIIGYAECAKLVDIP